VKVMPTTDRGRASLQRIVDAACDLFYRQGVADTGLSEVGESSGTGKGQLYHYFEDKDDLILTVIGARVEMILTIQRDELATIATADAFRAWGRALVAMHEEGGPVRCPLGALVVEVAERGPAFRAALDEGFTRWRAAIAGAIARLRDGGHIAAGRDPDELAEIVICAFEGGVLVSAARDGTRPLELAVTTAVEAVLRGAP
jgi:AcrR family transcriptional regulator